jgi:hypothetical protein
VGADQLKSEPLEEPLDPRAGQVLATGHNIGDVFNMGPVRIKLTPADHDYRPDSKKEDDSGFWMKTPDGTIWPPAIRV